MMLIMVILMIITWPILTVLLNTAKLYDVFTILIHAMHVEIKNIINGENKLKIEIIIKSKKNNNLSIIYLLLLL